MGSDLFISFQKEDLWPKSDLKILLEEYQIVVIERETLCFSKAKELVLTDDILFKNRRNILMIDQIVPFCISSTKVRLLLKRGYSIRYLVPDVVANYIDTNGLYRGS